MVTDFPSLPKSTPTTVAFVDESGAIAQDRHFAVGCLKLNDPDVLLRALAKLRDRRRWYNEIHFAEMKPRSLVLYREVVDLVAVNDFRFSCFVVDRDEGDPVARFGGPWAAYERLATQPLIASVRPGELMTVLADEYSSPDSIHFERDVCRAVNDRLDRLAIAKVLRLRSSAADGLQLADLLTSAITFEFRQHVGNAGRQSPKAHLAQHVRTVFGVPSFLHGHRDNRLNVAVYKHGRH
jgi:Protein of unknown function (DUF3800)